MNRNILHLRVEGFPVAVERIRDPSLKGRPVVICSRHSPRSPILGVSREAKAEGITRGLPLTKALRRCRTMAVLSPDEGRYRKAAQAISRLLERYSPLVEWDPWGRFYVDMTGTDRLFGAMQDSAFRIRREVQGSMGFLGTLGIASNKLVSGVAARVVESHGDLYAVPRGSEASFLAPLRIDVLPAARARKDRALLSEFNIRLVEELTAFSISQLTAVFGSRGVLLHRQSLGIDERPVRPPESKPFVLEERTLDEDTNDDALLLGIVYGMMERACSRMRAKGVMARTLWLHLRHSDGFDVTRRLNLKHPSVTDPLLFRKIEPFFLGAAFRRQRIGYLSLTFTDLFVPAAQLALFRTAVLNPKEGAQKAEALVAALDSIRTRYGEHAVAWGRTWGLPGRERLALPGNGRSVLSEASSSGL